MQEKSHNFKNCSKKSYVWQVKQTMSDKTTFSSATARSRFLHDMPLLQWSRPPQESRVRVEAPYCIGVGKVRVFESGQVISMRYCTGCGEACWNSLRHCVSLIDPFFYLFVLALLVCVHWDKKNHPPHLMTKVCPWKKKKKSALDSQKNSKDKH